MAAQTTWNGSKLESFELLTAIAHNCGCQYGPFKQRLKTCAPHDALARDQLWLDRLLFLKYLRDRLHAEEWLRKP